MYYIIIPRASKPMEIALLFVNVTSRELTYPASGEENHLRYVNVYINILVYIYCFFGGSVSSQEGNLMSSRLALSSSERSRFAIVAKTLVFRMFD